MHIQEQNGKRCAVTTCRLVGSSRSNKVSLSTFIRSPRSVCICVYRALLIHSVLSAVRLRLTHHPSERGHSVSTTRRVAPATAGLYTSIVTPGVDARRCGYIHSARTLRRCNSPSSDSTAASLTSYSLQYSYTLPWLPHSASARCASNPPSACVVSHAATSSAASPAPRQKQTYATAPVDFVSI